MDATFSYDYAVGWDELAQLTEHMGMHLEGDQIATVHADDHGSRCHSTQSFLAAVYLYQATHTLGVGYSEQVAKLAIIK
jgi:hypothetical protein